MTDDRRPITGKKKQLRQTQSYLRNLFGRHGIRPKRKLGQNFLIDLNIIDLIIREAQLTANDLVVEVGSGTGSLTAQLAQHAGAVVSVEVDSSFFSLTSEVVGDLPHVTLLHTDVLKNKNHLQPSVLKTINELRDEHPGCHLKLVANLPYAIATPVIANFLIGELPLELFVVTVQWEIAERLLARPATKNYASLAVLVQSLADVTLVRKLSPSVFWHRPEVESAVIRIEPSAKKRKAVGDAERFRSFLRDLYTHRRKNLRVALSGLPGGRLQKKEVDAQLAKLGLDGAKRAEELSVKEHLRLCEVFGA